MKELFRFLFGIALSTLSTMLGGRVLVDAWAWFVAPLGVPRLGLVQAMGLMLVAQMLRVGLVVAMTLEINEGRPERSADKRFKNSITGCVGSAFVYLLLWGVAATYHWIAP